MFIPVVQVMLNRMYIKGTTWNNILPLLEQSLRQPLNTKKGLTLHVQ